MNFQLKNAITMVNLINHIMVKCNAMKEAMQQHNSYKEMTLLDSIIRNICKKEN